MKDFTRTAVFLAVVLLTVACGGGKRQAVNDYLDAALPLLEEWHTIYASLTSEDRPPLAPVAHDIHDIRQRYDALRPPKPCWDFHDNVISAMDHSRRGLSATMAGKPDEEIDREFELTRLRLMTAREALAELYAEYGD